jgi:DNA processing protein
MDYTRDQLFWIWLSRTPGLNRAQFLKLIDAVGAPENAWKMTETAQGVLKPDVCEKLIADGDPSLMDAFFDKMEEASIYALTLLHDEYPESLRLIKDPPLTLYIRGSADHWNDRAIGIVGARNASRDGVRAAFDIAKGLAENGVTVISGMARGIDSAAHNGCLEGGERTVAVLGGSADMITSSESAQLAERIVREGGSVISEYPPGTPANKFYFPRRNRIISGMSGGVVLVEGGERSGSLITLNFAKEHNRVRFAMCWSMYSANSAAPIKLLKEGALPVTCASDIMNHFSWREREQQQKSHKPIVELDAEGKKLLDLLSIQEMSFDELCGSTGFAPPKLNSLLTIMQMRGIIEQLPGKLYRAIHP